MIRLFVFLFVSLILLCQCKPKVVPILIDSAEDYVKIEDVAEYERPCSYNENSAPDEYTLPKTVKVNVHFIDSPYEKSTWALDEGREYLKGVIDNANIRLGRNQKMNLPLGNDTPVLDPSFRYRIVGAEEGDDGFYHHTDSLYYYYLDRGPMQNNYDKAVIEKYAVRPDSILNIFVISHPQDSLDSETYKAIGVGIALGTSLKISGLYSNRKDPSWGWGPLLNHEVGHVLGLAHAWTKYDGCDDTPAHANCWDEVAVRGGTGRPCEGGFSNNVMDYNRSQMAFTPCQLGKVHKGFNRERAKTRGLIYPIWCEHDTTEKIIINSIVEWKGERDINKDILIQQGGRLDVHCRLSMAAGSKITLAPGAELHIHSHAKIHNSCEKKWEGIEVLDSKTLLSQLFIYGNGRILDTKTGPGPKTYPDNTL